MVFLSFFAAAHGAYAEKDTGQCLPYYNIRNQDQMSACIRKAEQGDAAAMKNVAYLHLFGQVTIQDYDEGIRWMRKAADMGNVGAQYKLGTYYRYGTYVAKDPVRAHKWFNLAAAAGSDDARKNLNEITKNMKLDQIREAQRLAREWLSRKSEAPTPPPAQELELAIPELE